MALLCYIIGLTSASPHKIGVGPAPVRSYKIGVVGNWLVGWYHSFLRNGSVDFSDILHDIRGL